MESDKTLDARIKDFQEGVRERCKGPLKYEHATFLKENFNVNDIHSLSDDEFGDLLMELGSIEGEEGMKQDNANQANPGNFTKLSELGTMVSGIVTYMGNQYRKGGRRYKGD